MYIFDMVGDNRVEGMQELLAPSEPGIRDVVVMNEARLEDVSAMVNFMVDPNKTDIPPNAVIVSAGIYDVLKIRTTPDRSVGLRNIVEDYTPKLIGGIFEELVESAFLLNPRVKIICCSIYGADLQAILTEPITNNHQYNNALPPAIPDPVAPPSPAAITDTRRVVLAKHSHQDLAERFILQINKGILDLNARFGVHTPYLDRVCHRYHPKKGDSYKYNELIEGYLPSLEQKMKCARLITSSLLKDSANW